MKTVVQTTLKNIFTFVLLLTVTSTPFVFAQQEKVINKDNAPQFLYGIASWYGSDFEGKTTASGEPYSSTGLTASHRSLPFGTRIEVENLSNGKKVEVIINDRGPFEQNRILNLSQQAAEILGFLSDDTTFVKVTILELGASLPTPIGLPSPPEGQDIPQGFRALPPVEETEETIVEDIPQDDLYDDTISSLTEVPSNALASDLTEIDDYESELFDENDLFADLDDEFNFMEDTFNENFTNENPQAKAQTIDENFANNTPAINPTGFNTNFQDILINDPLSNIVISEEDEYIVETTPPIEAFDTAPYGLTPQEREILNENSQNDPFADLFNDSSEPYDFQDEVNTSTVSPLTSEPPANHVNGNFNNQPIITNKVPKQPVQNKPVTNNIPVLNEFYYDNSYYGELIPTEATPPADYYEEPSQQQITPSPIQQTNKAPVQQTTNMIPQQQTTPKAEPVIPQRLGNHYIVQLGAFSKQKNALDLYEKLRGFGLNAYITDIKIKGKNLMRVRVGYFSTLEEAIQISELLQTTHNMENRIIKIDYEEQ